MSVVTLVADSVLLVGMVGAALYGASVLPASARVPVHFGFGGYNNWLPRNVGLVLWPAIGGVVYLLTIFVAGARQHSGSGSGPTLILTAALGVILVTQVGAIMVALRRNGRA